MLKLEPLLLADFLMKNLPEFLVGHIQDRLEDAELEEGKEYEIVVEAELMQEGLVEIRSTHGNFTITVVRKD